MYVCVFVCVCVCVNITFLKFLETLIFKDAFINDRRKTFHKKNPYFNILDGSLPKFQDT